MEEKNEGMIVQRIRNVLYTVRLKPAEGAKESYETKLRKMIENAAEASNIKPEGQKES